MDKISTFLTVVNIEQLNLNIAQAQAPVQILSPLMPKVKSKFCHLWNFLLEHIMILKPFCFDLHLDNCNFAFLVIKM